MTGSATRKVEAVLEAAERDGRTVLFEHEVYGLLQAVGIAVPRFFFLKRGEKAKRAKLASLPTKEVVLKIVSRDIVHKTDVGGVAFVSNAPAEVNLGIERMLAEVRRRCDSTSEPDIRGILVVEKIAAEDYGFGSELLLGIRNSREFGPIVTMGLGGLDVEYVNERLRERQAVAIGSAHLLAEEQIAELIRPLAFADKLIRGFRGREAPLAESALVEAYARFIRLAGHFSPLAGTSAYVIEEAEVNPFVIRRGKLIPLDAKGRFSRAKAAPRPSIHEGLEALLHPRSIGIIGVSERLNLGHLILNNILREGFPRERVLVVKPGFAEIEGCRCVASVAELPQTVDLFVLTLAAEQSVGVMTELVTAQKAKSVIIIASGMGEKIGTERLEAEVQKILSESRLSGKPTPVVNGGNCMGIYSQPGHYDTTFIPESKLAAPGKKKPRLVYISQSGAFMASRMSKIPEAEPRYGISLGNQIDLTASDYLNFFRTRPGAALYALYIEGFRPGDGLALAEAVREMTRKGRRTLVYKSGRTPEGKKATSSHTASVAGDYAVCRAVLEGAGAFVAETLAEFEQALKALPALDGKKAGGRRVGLLSNAGFECVIFADSLEDDFSLELAPLSAQTKARLADLLRPLGIDRLQDVRNPLDLTPVADDAAFAGCVEALLADRSVDCAVVSPVPMTAALQTLAPSSAHRENIYDPSSVGRRLAEIFRRSEKPIVINIDAGALYNPLAMMLEEEGLPVFRRSDEALRFLAKFVHLSLKAEGL